MERPPEACLEIENLEITTLQLFSVSFSKACLEIENLEITVLQCFSVSFSKACLETENLEITMLQFFSVPFLKAFSRDSVSFLIGTMNMFVQKVCIKNNEVTTK